MVPSTGMELNWTQRLSPSPPPVSTVSAASTWLLPSLRLSIHHTLKPSLLIWTQPKNRSVVSASQLQSPPIYYSPEPSRADGPPEGRGVAQLTRTCQALMHYHNGTEERAGRATRSPQ